MSIRVLLSFDVKEEHERIIQDLTAYGWNSIIRGVNVDTKLPVTCYLPETTWWIETNDMVKVYNDFIAIAHVKNILRADVFEFVNWRGTFTNPMKHQLEEEKKLLKSVA